MSGKLYTNSQTSQTEGPGAVTSLEVRIINAHSCMIGWKSPETGPLPIRGYYVEQSRLHSFGWGRINQIATESTFHLVSGLIAGRKYRFRVITEDVKGRVSIGKETDIVELLGRPDPPSGLGVYDITNRSCFLEWRPPDWDGGTPIAKYQIEKQKGYCSSWIVCDQVDGSTYAKRIDGLVIDTKYTFQIKAINKVGQSCPSPVSDTIVTSGNDVTDDSYLTGLNDDELEALDLKSVSVSFNRGLEKISSIVSLFQSLSPSITYRTKQKTTSEIQTLASVAYSNVLDAGQKIESLNNEMNRRIENLTRDQGKKESELEEKEIEISKINAEIKSMEDQLEELRQQRQQAEEDLRKAEEQLNSAEAQLRRQKRKKKKRGFLGAAGAVLTAVAFGPAAGLVVGGLTFADCKNMADVIRRAREIRDVADQNRNRLRERVDEKEKDISSANNTLTRFKMERDKIKTEVDLLKAKITCMRQKLAKQVDISSNMKQYGSFISTAVGKTEILHDQTKFLYQPGTLLGPLRELTNQLYLPDANRLGDLLSGNNMGVMLVKVKIIAAADVKWRESDLLEHEKDLQIFMGSKSGKLVLQTMTDIGAVSDTIFTQENALEDATMIMSSHAGWEQLLSPAPAAVALLGQFLLLSLKRDFPLDIKKPTEGFNLLRQPESFRASIIQIVNEGWKALNTAHEYMDQIRIYMECLPDHITTAFNMISSASDNEIKTFLHLPLAAVKLIAEKSLQKAKQAENGFTEVFKMMSELQEACVSTKGFYEGQRQKKKMTLGVAREEMSLVEEERKHLDIQRQNILDSIKEAETQFGDAILSLPDGWNLFGMAVTDGIVSTFKATIDLLSKPMKKTKRQNNSKDSNPLPENGQEKLDTKIRQVHKQAVILQNIVNCFASRFVEAGFLNVEEIQKNSKVAYCESQLNFIIQRLKKVETCPAKEEIEMLCKRAIKICQHLEKEAKSFRSDKNNTGDVVEEILLVQQIVKSFVAKLKISVDSVEQRCIHSRNSCLPPDSGKGVVKYELEKVQARVEQTCAQLRYAQARYDEVCRTINEANSWFGVLLSAITRLDMELLNACDIIDLLGRSMNVLAELRQPWGRIVRFIGSISNLIDCTINETLRNFADNANPVATSRVEGYNIPHFMREMLYQQVLLVSEIAQFLATLADSYTVVSAEHLLPNIARLPVLLKFDPNTQKDALKLHSLELKNTCEAAQQSIIRMLEQKKREFDAAMKARITTLQTIKNQRLAEIEQLVKQTSGVSLWDSTELNPEDFV